MVVVGRGSTLEPWRSFGWPWFTPRWLDAAWPRVPTAMAERAPVAAVQSGDGGRGRSATRTGWLEERKGATG
jgi:hypothetical protein